MKQQVRITIGSPDTGEIFEHADMGVVEKLDMRRRQHRDGWVTEANFPSCYASAVRWLDAHGYLEDQPVHKWSVKINIGLDSLAVGSGLSGEPTKIVDVTTISGDSVRYIVKGTDNLAKRYDAWDFEHESDPKLYAFDLDVRYVFDFDGFDVDDIIVTVAVEDPDFLIASIDSITYPDPFDWAERPTYMLRSKS